MAGITWSDDNAQWAGGTGMGRGTAGLPCTTVSTSTGPVGEAVFTTFYCIHSSVPKYFIKNKFTIVLAGRKTLPDRKDGLNPK